MPYNRPIRVCVISAKTLSSNLLCIVTCRIFHGVLRESVNFTSCHRKYTGQHNHCSSHGKVSDGRPKPKSVYVVKQTESCLGPFICEIRIEIRYVFFFCSSVVAFFYQSLHIDVDNGNPPWANGTDK